MHGPIDPDIAECLRMVADPELGINIVDLGLVYEAERGASGIRVRITLTSRACPLGALVMEQVRARLAERFPALGEPGVALVWTPQWSPDLITDEGYALMGRERKREMI